MLYLRARYYAPEMGVFASLDPFEGIHDRPMSLNGYSWVEGNTPNRVDPNGMSVALASVLNTGLCGILSQIDDCGCTKPIVVIGANGEPIPGQSVSIRQYIDCIRNCNGIMTPQPPPPTSLPPAWNTPTFTTFPIDVSNVTSPAYQDLFGNGADGQGARGCRLFAVQGEYPSTGSIHSGFDYYVPEGTEVRSVGDGIVVGITQGGTPSAHLVQSMAPEDVSFSLSTVIVRYGYSYTIFAHLGMVSVNVGDRVSPGNTLGTVGAYNDGFGSHLHLEVRNFSQLLTYDRVTGAGIEPNTGIISQGATSAANPLLFVNPFQYFDANSQQLMDSCVAVTYNSPRYPNDFERPNGALGRTPSTQNTHCFQGAGDTVDFAQCNLGLGGAPQ